MTFQQHPLFARFMARRAIRNERLGQAALRDEQLAGLAGTVVEAGAGSGVSFSHYPATVTEVIAVEPSDYLREQAGRAAAQASVPVRVVDGVLCSVTNPAAVLAEFRRVLRPGGELRFYEHIRSRRGLLGRWQDAADAVWPRLMGGCHPNRDTLTAIRTSGFAVESCRGLLFPPDSRFSVVGPRILGVARG
jgi:SAM-dependent methyltransferase